jgi:hypothetical protein
MGSWEFEQEEAWEAIPLTNDHKPDRGDEMVSARCAEVDLWHDFGLVVRWLHDVHLLSFVLCSGPASY